MIHVAIHILNAKDTSLSLFVEVFEHPQERLVFVGVFLLEELQERTSVRLDHYEIVETERVCWGLRVYLSRSEEVADRSRKYCSSSDVHHEVILYRQETARVTRSLHFEGPFEVRIHYEEEAREDYQLLLYVQGFGKITRKVDCTNEAEDFYDSQGSHIENGVPN